jgi:catechol 2,3-dioxygenase-like lactoylglutathione lyase family enzyme
VELVRVALFLGVNHVGYAVSDLDLAGRFVVEVLGFEPVPERSGVNFDPDGDLLTQRFGVHPRARGEFRFFRHGDGLVEFLQWESPDYDGAPARNSDLSGRHLAVSTTDMAAAKAAIEAFGDCEIRAANERGYVYVKTPFGLEVQLMPA